MQARLTSQAWAVVVLATATTLGCGGRAPLKSNADAGARDGGDADVGARDVANADAPPATSAADAGGRLAILTADGAPVPAAEAYGGDIFVFEAVDPVTNQPVNDAQWTATGACATGGPATGPTLTLQQSGAGACTLTATVAGQGPTATVTFTIYGVTGVRIDGDTSALALGEVRTFKAVVLSDTIEMPSVPITWDWDSAAGLFSVVGVETSGSTVKVTGLNVGLASLSVRVASQTASVALSVNPSSIRLTTPEPPLDEPQGGVLPGGMTTVLATAVGPTGNVSRFAFANTGVTLTGADGFGSVGAYVGQSDGSLLFELGDAKADSPAVTAHYGAVVSNALAFSLVRIGSVVVHIDAVPGPVSVGTTIGFGFDVLDTHGRSLTGDALSSTWTDATGVYSFPTAPQSRLSGDVIGTVVKLGTSAVVATVGGVASAPLSSTAVPNQVVLQALSTTSIAVGGKVTLLVSVVDAKGGFLVDLPASDTLSVTADDATKISFVPGPSKGTGFLFTGTGLAATSAAGILLVATWSDGTNTFTTAPVPLVITGP